MKKNVFEMIHTLVNGGTVEDMGTLRAEVNAEWEKMAEKKSANQSLYNAAHDILIAALTDTPQTAKEIYEGNEWPDDFTQSKLNYALRAMWNEEVNRIENGKNPLTYTRKVK